MRTVRVSQHREPDPWCSEQKEPGTTSSCPEGPEEGPPGKPEEIQDTEKRLHALNSAPFSTPQLFYQHEAWEEEESFLSSR